MSNDVNFKRLDELEVIESSAENAHVLAEVNGVPKRIPASSVGGGSNMVEKVLFEAQGLEFIYSEEEGVYINNSQATFAIALNQSYKVVWDGEEYDCVANFDLIDWGLPPMFGNVALIAPEEFGAPDSGEPFVILANEGALFIAHKAGESPHDVKISTIVEKSSGGMMRINVTTEDYETYTADKTYEQIAEAISNGIIPYCVWHGLVFWLVNSTAIKSVSTYGRVNAHEFACLKDTLQFQTIKIESNERVTYTSKFLLASDV